MMKMGKPSPRVYSLLFLFLIVLIVMSLSIIQAITASIGNARMVLRVKQGESIEKYVLIKNVNNVSVNIQLDVSGDLEDYIKLNEKNFNLNPGEGKKAYFTIDAKKSGSSETKINVKFIPSDGSNGVGLSSTVIVIAEESKSGWFDWFSGDDKNNATESDNNETSGDVSIGSKKTNINQSTINNKNPQATEDPKKSNSLLVISSIVSIILLLLLIILVFYSKKIRNKKSEVIEDKKNQEGTVTKPKKSVKLQ